MGKRRALLSVVRRAFSCQSKEKRRREKKNRKSGKRLESQRSINLDSFNEENVVEVVPAVPTVRAVHSSSVEDVKLMEAENEQNRHAYSVALATAAAAEAAVAAAHAAAEVVRLTAASRHNMGKTKEEIAAIKIQTAFRGYMARRALRALRGLARLKALVGRQSVKSQASTTLKCMQTMARVQSEIRARRIRMSEQNSAIQRQIQQKREKELEKSRPSVGENWNASANSKEQVDAKLQNKQEAAMRRERALAYAYSHQQTWRNSNPANQTFLDPNNPHWGWSWLERWMAARPWENGSAADLKELTGDQAWVKSTTSRSVPVRADTKPQSPTARPPSRQSPSTPDSKVARKVRPPSSRKGTDEDSRSINSIQCERCRRHSIAGSSVGDDESLWHSVAGSSVRDDESLASSSATFRGYMASTVSARARSRLSSPFGAENVGTPRETSGAGSAKKRLSFSGSPAVPRRHSGPPKIDSSHIKDITNS